MLIDLDKFELSGLEAYSHQLDVGNTRMLLHRRWILHSMAINVKIGRHWSGCSCRIQADEAVKRVQNRRKQLSVAGKNLLG
jgi:hypothetical protein